MKGFLGGILAGTALGAVALGVVSLVAEPPKRPLDILGDQDVALEQGGADRSEDEAQTARASAENAISENDSMAGQVAPQLRPAPQDAQSEPDDPPSNRELDDVAAVDAGGSDEQPADQSAGQVAKTGGEVVEAEPLSVPVVVAAVPQQPSVPKGPEAEHSDPEFGLALIVVEDAAEPAPRLQDENQVAMEQELTSEDVPTAEVGVPAITQREPSPSSELSRSKEDIGEPLQEVDSPLTPVFIDGEDVVAGTLEAADSLAPPSDETGVDAEVVVVGEDDAAEADNYQRLTAAQVKINRPGADEPEVAPAEIVAASQGSEALKRFAVAPPQNRGLPQFAIALVPAESGPAIGLEDLAQAGVTVSVLLNPEAEDAGARVADYRAAGVEVGVYAALPQGAQANDLAVYFEAALSTLPETTVLVPQGFQASPSLNEELLAIAQKEGHGLLFAANGLNSIIRDAEKNAVPARTFYRYLQDETASAQTLARFLEQASFRAQRQDGIIVLGRATPAMFEALSLWAQSRRAQSVDAVPLSAMFAATPE